MVDKEMIINEFKRAVDLFTPSDTSDEYFKELCCSVFKLLKEQEPIEPSATDSGVRIEYNCGSCGRWFCFKSKIHPEMGFRTRYCPHCGRSVKWDD